MHSDRILLRLAALAMRRPGLIAPMLRAAWRFRAERWWSRPPFLPLPPEQYMAWRLHTAFGDENAIPEAAQLERYLRWTRTAAPRKPEVP